MTGRILLFTVLAMTGAAWPATAACVWEFGPSFPLFPPQRKQAAAVNQNGTIVVLGGRPFVGGGEQAPVHYLEPPDYLVWTSGVPFEEAVMQPAAGVDSFGRILVAGGWSFDDTGGGFFPTNLSFVYDIGSGNIGGISPFTCSRAKFAFATDNLGRLYLFGGLDIDLIAQDCVERYDAGTDTWSPLTSLPEPLSDAAAVYDGVGHILVIGGADAVGLTQATVYSYDIAGDTWTTIDPEPVALERQAAVLGADGRVYVVGGFSSNFPTSLVFIYDPATTLWSTGPSLNMARWGAAITLGDDDSIYAMGGFTSGSTATNTVERLGTGLLGNDCNNNGVPDECELDCQPNGVPDDCDVDPSDPDGDGQVSDDINGNGVPDECDECVQHADCDDTVDCTIDTCDPGTSTCSNVPDNSACDNTVFCDGVEICHPVNDCQPGTPPSCSDGVACTVDTCDAILDDCVHTPDDLLCDNSLFCDGTEACDALLGCRAGTPVDCGDGVDCTDDSCNEGTDSCDNIPNDANCANGLFCDGAETCDPVNDCQAGSDPCPGQSCDEVNDVCTGGSLVAPAPEGGGAACMTSSDCLDDYAGADCVAGVCYVPKNRYLSIDPSTNPGVVAYQVELVESAPYPDAVGRKWWVDVPQCIEAVLGDPVDPPPNPECTGASMFGWVSRLSVVPVNRTWTESPLHITDCAVAPVVTYKIRASDDDGASFSAPLEIATAHNPEGESQHWGDVTGGPVPGMPGLWLPPERATNLGDVEAAIKTFEDYAGVTGFPAYVWADVEIDQVINLGDVQFLVMAFEGTHYSDIDLPLIGADPTGCP